MSKTHVKKGDVVMVIAGDGRNKWSGKVLAVLRNKNRVIVEGCALMKKHQRKTQDRPKGGIVEKEGTIHISNVMLKERWDKLQAKKQPAKPEAVTE
jgi:large subunit ribosomal protein L24